MNQSYRNGFMAKCAEQGLSPEEAAYLFEKKAQSFMSDPFKWVGNKVTNALGTANDYYAKDSDLENGSLPGNFGSSIGNRVGGALGRMFGTSGTEGQAARDDARNRSAQQAQQLNQKAQQIQQQIAQLQQQLAQIRQQAQSAQRGSMTGNQRRIADWKARQAGGGAVQK